MQARRKQHGGGMGRPAAGFGWRVPRLAAMLLTVSGPVQAEYQDDVGYTRLAAELAERMPTGGAVEVTQVEALANDAHYHPNTNLAAYAGKTFVDVTGTATGFSGHATSVGTFLYGSTTAMAGGIPRVDVYEAGSWQGSSLLRTGTGSEPRSESRNLESHSWVLAEAEAATNTLRRLDYAIRRDGFSAVVGLNNGSSTELPDLLAHAFNVITVGRTDGDHSRGPTRFETPGRVKPDLVAPGTKTSWAVPMVAAASALLLEAAQGDPLLADATRPESLKALLLAGATKGEFPGWDRTESRPLDEVFGAGELNVRLSYFILAAGPQPAAADQPADRYGWRRAVITPGRPETVYFEVPADRMVPEFSAALTWPRHVEDGNPSRRFFDPVPTDPNLDLYLYRADGEALGSLVDVSTSAVDNVEHLFPALGAGGYALRVVTDLETEYALAWRGDTTVPPKITGVRLSEGQVRISGEGGTGFTQELQVSDGGGVWSTIAENEEGSSPYVFADPAAHGRRIYRIRLQRLH